MIVEAADALPKPVSEGHCLTYLADPNPQCVLCLVAEKLAKNTRLYKAVARVGAKAIIDCTPLERWNLLAYVVKLAAGHGLTMDVDAADELVNRVGVVDRGARQPAQEPGRAARRATHHPRRRRGKRGPGRRGEPLGICRRRLRERDAARALVMLGAMRSPAYVFLHSVLLGRLRELICAQSLDARGASSQVAHELGRQQWQVKNHARWARRFGRGELVVLLREAAVCERALKGSPDSETAFVRFVLAICTPRAH